MEKVRAILTGATGMVAEGVLKECLRNERIEKVLVIGRRSCGVSHPKLTEIVHKDFFDPLGNRRPVFGLQRLFLLSRNIIGRRFKRRIRANDLRSDDEFCRDSGEEK